MKHSIRLLLVAVAALGVHVRAYAELPETVRIYSADPEHPWDRLHRALFVRTLDERLVGHELDPFLYPRTTYLLRGDTHRAAIDALDAFAATGGGDFMKDSRRRAILQRDLWAAFDWCAMRIDEPAALALRRRLAVAIKLLALNDGEIAQLVNMPDQKGPDGNPMIVPELFDEGGPWVRIGRFPPLAEHHTANAGARSSFTVLLRLPEGRAATLKYISEMTRSPQQFPIGTQVALVRRGLVIDVNSRPRPTGLTESIQVRTFLTIPPLPPPHTTAPGDQRTEEYLLDRPAYFDQRPSLRTVGPDDDEVPFQRMVTGLPLMDRFDGDLPAQVRTPHKALSSCIHCHQLPGIHSVLSVTQHLQSAREGDGPLLRPYTFDADQRNMPAHKLRRYDWGLLQGMLEGQ